VANAVRRQATISEKKIITQARERIRRNAMPKRHRRLQNNGLTPSETKAKWLRERISEELWAGPVQQANTGNDKQPRRPTWKQAIKKITNKN
jgi:hypothetical protein